MKLELNRLTSITKKKNKKTYADKKNKKTGFKKIFKKKTKIKI
jgi:hypothetical protein